MLWTGADQTWGQINLAQDVALPQPSRVTGQPGVQGPLGWRSLCLAPRGPQEHSALCPLNPPLVSLANFLLLKAAFPWEPSLVSGPHLKPRQNQGLHPQVPWAQGAWLRVLLPLGITLYLNTPSTAQLAPEHRHIFTLPRVSCHKLPLSSCHSHTFLCLPCLRPAKGKEQGTKGKGQEAGHGEKLRAGRVLRPGYRDLRHGCP